MNTRDWDEIRCPHCLKTHDKDELEKLTEYGCWSSEECCVSCPDCDKQFEVKCEHAGFNATTDFDAQTWCRQNLKLLAIEDRCWSTSFSIVRDLECGRDPMRFYNSEIIKKYNDQRQRHCEIIVPLWEKFVGRR